jgi:hypothetical protein
MIPNATFALGATSFEYRKEIPIMSKFIVENSLLGYDKKWVSRLSTMPRMLELIVLFELDSFTFKPDSTRLPIPRLERSPPTLLFSPTSS